MACAVSLGQSLAVSNPSRRGQQLHLPIDGMPLGELQTRCVVAKASMVLPLEASRACVLRESMSRPQLEEQRALAAVQALAIAREAQRLEAAAARAAQEAAAEEEAAIRAAQEAAAQRAAELDRSKAEVGASGLVSHRFTLGSHDEDAWSACQAEG